MAGADEYRFVGVLCELPSHYAHIMNVAVDVPRGCPTPSDDGAMSPSWALPMERTSWRPWYRSEVAVIGCS